MRGLAKQTILSLTALMVLLMACEVLAAGTNNLAVTATVLSKSNCRFNSATSSLNLGNLDPANPIDVTLTATVGFVCRGSANPATFFNSDDGGLYNSGGPRMRHTTALTEFLPYSLTLSPVTATVPKNVSQTLTITGKVLGSNYKNAYTGSYNDTVVISIVP